MKREEKEITERKGRGQFIIISCKYILEALLKRQCGPTVLRLTRRNSTYYFLYIIRYYLLYSFYVTNFKNLWESEGLKTGMAD